MKYRILQINFFYFVLILINIISIRAEALKIKDKEIIFERLSDYNSCNSQNHTAMICYDALIRWVQVNKSDAFVAGHMVRNTMTSSSAVSLFATAFSNSSGKCDEEVRLAVISGLNLPAESKDIVRDSLDIAFNKCFPEFRDDLVDNVSTSNSYFLANTCSQLLQRKVLKGIKLKVCTQSVVQKKTIKQGE